MRESRAAEARNETASTRKAVSRPNTVATTPPSAAPTASIVPQSEPPSALAVGRSSGLTRFGIAADEAGSNGAREDRQDREQRVGEPDGAGPHEQEGDADDHAREVAGDHQLAPVDPVGEGPRPGGGQEEGDLLRQDRQAHVDRTTGGLQDQPVDRHEQEPVAAERDHRGREEPAEVAVAPEQRDAGAEPALGERDRRSRRCRDSAFVHGGSSDYPSTTEEEALTVLDRITWFRQSALRWVDDERTIYIDPWGTDEDAPPADLILITHAHVDHFQPEEIERLRKDRHEDRGAPRRGGGAQRRRDPGGAGRGSRDRGRPFTTVPAYNTREEALDFHPRANRWVGYVLELGGATYYHAGDTDHAPELDDVKTDVAFLPVGGYYTMNVPEAAGLVRAMSPGSPCRCTSGSWWAPPPTATVPRGGRSRPVEIMTPTNPFERE